MYDRKAACDAIQCKGRPERGRTSHSSLILPWYIHEYAENAMRVQQYCHDFAVTPSYGYRGTAMTET